MERKQWARPEINEVRSGLTPSAGFSPSDVEAKGYYSYSAIGAGDMELAQGVAYYATS